MTSWLSGPTWGSLMVVLLVAGATVPVGVAQAQTADTSDTGVPLSTDDLDGDGWSPAGGDCDDNELTVNPGVVETCEDRIDNNCDGLLDEGCDSRIFQATLRGGGGCTGGSGVGNTAFLLLPLSLLMVGRRRS